MLSPDEAGLTEAQNVGADPRALNGTWGGLESGRAKKLHHLAAGLLGIPGRKARIIAQQVGVDRHQRNAIVFETNGQPKLRLFRSTSTKPKAKDWWIEHRSKHGRTRSCHHRKGKQV